ncbi:MAG: DUF748 domain-containing protein [Chthoniobacterales bacterium]
MIKRLLKWQVQLLIVLIALLVGLRIALPYIVKSYANKKINEMPDYSGHIGDVYIKLWRGAYQIRDIEIFKSSGKVPVPFFSSEIVEFSVEWRALFNGALVAKVKFIAPELNFVNGPSHSSSQIGVDKPWNEVLRKLVPMDINRFEVKNGVIHYRDFHSDPKVNLQIDHIEMLGTNFTNSAKLSKTLVAAVTFKGRVFNESTVTGQCKIDPWKENPTFTLNFQMRPLSLVKINEFVRAYAKFDFEKGTLAITSELAASDGKIIGYVKPIFDDISVINLKEDIKNPLKLVWEGVVGGVLRLFRNQPHNRFATKIPIEGDFSNPKKPLLPILGNILKNAFLHVYTTDLDHSVSLEKAEKAEAEAAKEEKAQEKKP